MKNIKNNYSFIIVAIILIAVLVFKQFYSARKSSDYQSSGIIPFNRNESHLILTKHAKCRMQCRDITEDEIKEILHDGNINYNKSNPNDKRGATYALEGYSHEHQHLRIVVAPEDDGLVVVTCIDLDKKWQCDCN